MSKTLSEFLAARNIDNLTQDVELKTIPGFKFKIKAMNMDKYSELRKHATISTKGGEIFNNEKYSALCVIHQTVEPNFSDAEMIKNAGLTLPIHFLQSRLTAGEISTLYAKIIKLSGFDVKSLEDEEEEIKN